MSEEEGLGNLQRELARSAISKLAQELSSGRKYLFNQEQFEGALEFVLSGNSIAIIEGVSDEEFANGQCLDVPGWPNLQVVLDPVNKRVLGARMKPMLES